MKVVIATGNQGKLKEFRDLLGMQGIEVVAQSDLNVVAPEETGLSFVENAILKARAASEQTGLPAIADDSGIAVDSLNGAPGIYSARFAGEHASDAENVDLLLRKLEGFEGDARGAQFHCVLVYLKHAADPTPLICHGVWEGQITSEKAGNEGFGYDPVFWVPEKNCTAAELTKAQKNAISHRGKATRALLEKMTELNA